MKVRNLKVEVLEKTGYSGNYNYDIKLTGEKKGLFRWKDFTVLADFKNYWYTKAGDSEILIEHRNEVFNLLMKDKTPSKDDCCENPQYVFVKKYTPLKELEDYAKSCGYKVYYYSYGLEIVGEIGGVHFSYICSNTSRTTEVYACLSCKQCQSRDKIDNDMKISTFKEFIKKKEEAIKICGISIDKTEV